MYYVARWTNLIMLMWMPCVTASEPMVVRIGRRESQRQPSAGWTSMLPEDTITRFIFIVSPCCPCVQLSYIHQPPTMDNDNMLTMVAVEKEIAKELTNLKSDDAAVKSKALAGIAILLTQLPSADVPPGVLEALPAVHGLLKEADADESVQVHLWCCTCMFASGRSVQHGSTLGICMPQGRQLRRLHSA